MTQVPDLFQIELDNFARELITAALEAAEGDAELAAALKQSPKRFIEEGRRLGLIAVPTSGQILAMPEPETELLGHEWRAPEPEEKPHVVEEPGPEDAQTTAGAAELEVLDRGNGGVSDPDPQAPPRKSRPGRPAGRRRSPLGEKPLPVSGSRRLSRLRGDAAAPRGDSETSAEDVGELAE